MWEEYKWSDKGIIESVKGINFVSKLNEVTRQKKYF